MTLNKVMLFADQLYVALITAWQPFNALVVSLAPLFGALGVFLF